MTAMVTEPARASDPAHVSSRTSFGFLKGFAIGIWVENVSRANEDSPLRQRQIFYVCIAHWPVTLVIERSADSTERGEAKDD